MKSQSKKQTWIWIIILVVFIAFLSVFSYSQKPKVYPNFVSESPSPSGVKAFYTYLAKETDTKRWTTSPILLPKTNEKKLLVMIEPAFMPDPEEIKAYNRFMKAGNTILLLKNNPKGMFSIKTKNSPSNEETKVMDQNHIAFKAEDHSIVRLEDTKQDKVLLSDQNGTVALKRTIGNGQLIVGITPEWVMNDTILKKDHLKLLLKLINYSNAQTVLFDEYIHGGQGGMNDLNVYPKWFILMILQGSIIILLWLWSKGKRFGPLLTPREETVRFSDEGIRALTAWYLRGKLYQDSLIIQADYVKLLLQERWQIPYSREWGEIAANLEKKQRNMSKGELETFLNGLISVLRKEKISKQEYLLWSRKLDQLRKEVEEG